MTVLRLYQPPLCRAQEGEPTGCLWLLQEGQLLAIKHAVQWKRLKAPALVGELLRCPRGGLSQMPLRSLRMNSFLPLVELQERLGDV